MQKLIGKGVKIRLPVTVRMQMTDHTVVKLDPELGRRLKVEAAIRGITMRQLVEALLEEHLSVRMPKAPHETQTATGKATSRPPPQSPKR